MAADIVLYKGSKKCLTYSGTEVPDGLTVDKAYWMLKNAWSDADVSALISKDIDSVEDAAEGVISDNGAGDNEAELMFYIAADDCDDIEPGTYFCSVKAILSDSSAYVFPDSFQTVQVYASGIEAVT